MGAFAWIMNNEQQWATLDRKGHTRKINKTTNRKTLLFMNFIYWQLFIVHRMWKISGFCFGYWQHGIVHFWSIRYWILIDIIYKITNFTLFSFQRHVHCTWPTYHCCQCFLFWPNSNNNNNPALFQINICLW